MSDTLRSAAILAMSLAALSAGHDARAQNLDVKGTTTAEGNAYFYNRVGIGTVSPATALHVQTATANDAVLLSGSSGWAGFYINLGYAAYNGITVAGDRGFIYGGATLGNPGGGFTIAPWAGTTSGLRLDPGGNVGVGARSPAVKLAVNGGGRDVYATDLWVENNMHVQGNESVAGGRGRLRLGTAWGYEGLYAEANSAGAGNDLVLGASSGQVRIGCTGCGQNLFVSGSVQVSGVVHASQGVAVYDCTNACAGNLPLSLASFTGSTTCQDVFGGGYYAATCTFVGRLVSP